MLPILLLLAAPTPVDGIGDLSKQEFLNLVSGWGYSVQQSPTEAGTIIVSSAGTRFTLHLDYMSGGNSKSPKVGAARGLAVFRLPKMLPRRELDSFRAKSLSEWTVPASYLDGVVDAQQAIWIDPKQTEGSIRAHLDAFAKDLKSLQKYLVPLHGKPSDNLYGMGDASLDESIVVSELYERDYAFILEKKHWSVAERIGGGNGWGLSAKVNDLRFGIGGSDSQGMRTSQRIWVSRRVEPGKLQAWRSKEAAGIQWASVIIDGENLSIDSRINLLPQTTVSGVIATITHFVDQVRTINLPGDR